MEDDANNEQKQKPEESLDTLKKTSESVELTYREKQKSKKKIIIVVLLLLLAGLLVYVVASDSRNDKSNVDYSTGKSVPVDQKQQEVKASTYVIVDTNQKACFNNTDTSDCDSAFQGQDAHYNGNQPSYTDNGDGTITDNVTGLMWIKSAGIKMTYAQATNNVDTFELAGYEDWRVPNIKELYSLMDFSGEDIDPTATNHNVLDPFIDDNVFDFEYGDTSSGSRIIDSQWVTSNKYVSTVMGDQECFFGVNFADGRIKCYPTQSRRNQGYFVRYVRGEAYGTNDFQVSGDTVIDNSTLLVWEKSDSGRGMNWSEALSYCEDLSLAGRDDWRLPNAKELNSIVDYSRSPDTTNSPAINALFETSSITNEANQSDFPFFWTSTTHKDQAGGQSAVYLSFGRALGNMSEFGGWIDVHGAGAQRSDPKVGPNQYPDGHGPQGDAVRIDNYVRCVSDL